MINIILHLWSFHIKFIKLAECLKFWFGLILYAPVNSYGHVGMVSSTSPNRTYFLGKLDYIL